MRAHRKNSYSHLSTTTLSLPLFKTRGSAELELVSGLSAHETCLVKNNGKHFLPMESSISATMRNPILTCTTGGCSLLFDSTGQQHLLLACDVKPPTIQAILTIFIHTHFLIQFLNVMFPKLYLEVALNASVMNKWLCLLTSELVNQKKLEFYSDSSFLNITHTWRNSLVYCGKSNYTDASR